MQSNLHLGPTLHNGLFFGGEGGGGSPCIESCLDLSTTATFFCHQGDRYGEVQLQNKERIRFSLKKVCLYLTGYF